MLHDAHMKQKVHCYSVCSTIVPKSWTSKQVGARPVIAKGCSTVQSNTLAGHLLERCPVDTSAGPPPSNTMSSLWTETAQKGSSYKAILAGAEQTLSEFRKIQRSGRLVATSVINEVGHVCLTSTGQETEPASKKQVFL